MPWGAVAGAVVGAVANKALNKNKNGGAGTETQTATKEPWEAAAPWLKNLLQQGSDLSQQYQDNPFSEQQKTALANQYAQGDYMRSLVPSLLGQMQKQQVGFDRNNPQAKPNAWDFTNFMTEGAPNLGQSSMTAAQGRADQAAADQAAAKAAAAAAQKGGWSGDFVNQSEILNGLNYAGLGGGGAGMYGAGGFGDWRYGMTPEVGTKAYRDMTEYFNYGGFDPNNMYGRDIGKAGTVSWNPFPQGINWGA